MELKEYLNIIKKRSILFFSVILAVVIIAFAWLIFSPQYFVSSISIVISRTGQETSEDYRYDQYYRVLADEKFSETIGGMLSSSNFVQDVIKDAKLADAPELDSFFKIKKTSPQLMQVEYRTMFFGDAPQIADTLERHLINEINSLNIEDIQSNWFSVEISEPLVGIGKPSSFIVLIFSLLVGLFLGFWSVFISYYFSKEDNNQ